MTRAALALLAAALVLSAAAAAATPGVRANEILIGGTAPLSGAGASQARGAAAYFRYVNAHGGVFGRTIAYEVLGDASDPAQALADVQRLVEQDDVLAVFGALGTAQNLALRDYLNGARVPQLFAGSGATALGADRAAYPWTIGYGPTYRAQGEAYGRYLAASLPTARVGVLYRDDADGADLLAGLGKGLGARRSQIVAAESYEPTDTDVSSQVAALQAAGATVLCVFAFGDASTQALADATALGWAPRVVVADDAATARLPAGAISAAYLKDPAAPKWATDPGIALYRQIVRRYGAGLRPSDRYAIAGMASAFTLVDALRRAGKSPTRASVMRAATSLNEANNPFLLPGIVVRTSATARFPVSQLQLEQWTRGRWQPLGGLLTARP